MENNITTQKKRNTVQRKIISEIVMRLKHPTAENVFSEIMKHNLPLSLPTVYRNLNMMVETGELEKICMGDTSDRFDSNINNHYHFRCSVCGEIFDLPTSTYDSELNSLCEKQLGFKIDKHILQFIGICNNCQKI